MQRSAKIDSGQGGGKDGVFTLEEYRTDMATVVAYATAHGRARVFDEDGQLHVVISMPTAEHPLDID
jgi:hypothetical protein